MTDHTASSTGQVAPSAAEVYESFFVPALFGQWPERVLGAAGLRAGDTLLDVGCGTGIVARSALDQLAGTGSVTGVDINDAMLTVARRASNEVTWLRAPVEALPFDDDTFDRVVSQFMLMFLPDPGAGVSEMRRVVRRGGTVTIATWADISESPGYLAMAQLLDRLFGGDVAAALYAPFTLGTESALFEALRHAFPNVAIARHEGVAQFPSLDAWVHTDVRGWTLAELIDDDQFAELQNAARSELAKFVDHEGIVRFAAPALLARAMG